MKGDSYIITIVNCMEASTNQAEGMPEVIDTQEFEESKGKSHLHLSLHSHPKIGELGRQRKTRNLFALVQAERQETSSTADSSPCP